MKRQTRVTLALALAALAAQASNSSTTAKVIYAGLYGDGRLFVALDAPINEPGCVNSRFDVPADHPQIKSWLAIALTASASGQPVVVRTSGCYDSFPTMTQNMDTWFYLIPN
jgi:hypothetical protein